jgi:hypothetical protein
VVCKTARALRREAGDLDDPGRCNTGRANFASCDPSQWPDDMELSANVGLGTGNKD